MAARVTEDEIDKRMRELRDKRKAGQNIDASTVRGIPAGKHAHWVNRHSRNGARIQHFENHGYELAEASKDHKDGKGIRALGGRVIEGNRIVNGDNILMLTDRENLVDRLATKKLRGKQAEEAFMAKKVDDMRRIASESGVGVEIINTSKQGADRIVRRGQAAPDDDD